MGEGEARRTFRWRSTVGGRFRFQMTVARCGGRGGCALFLALSPPQLGEAGLLWGCFLSRWHGEELG
jgi:hypothetical protein